MSKQRGKKGPGAGVCDPGGQSPQQGAHVAQKGSGVPTPAPPFTTTWLPVSLALLSLTRAMRMRLGPTTVQGASHVSHRSLQWAGETA